ncbi:hypothetical protein U1Q18_049471, partial [Sarracenia purpurea var. burkii]
VRKVYSGRGGIYEKTSRWVFSSSCCFSLIVFVHIAKAFVRAGSYDGSSFTRRRSFRSNLRSL